MAKYIENNELFVLNDHDLFLHTDKLKELKYYKPYGNYKIIINKLNILINIKQNLYLRIHGKNELK